MLLIKKFLKARTSSSGSTVSDTNSVSEMPTATGGRHRDSGVFDDSASISSFSEPASPPFVVDGPTATRDTDSAQVRATYVASRPRKTSIISFRRSGSTASRTSVRSESSSSTSSANGACAVSTDPTGSVKQSLPTITSNGSASSADVYAMMWQPIQPSTNPVISSDDVTTATATQRHDGTVSSGPGVPAIFRRTAAFDNDAEVVDSTMPNVSDTTVSTFARDSYNHSTPPEIRGGSSRDGQKYAKKSSVFGFLPLLPNRYQQQMQHQKLPKLKGNRLHRSLDGTGFTVAATGEAQDITASNEARPKRSSMIIVDKPHEEPVAPPRRNRAGRSTMGRNESLTLDVDSSAPITHRHSIAANELMASIFSAVDRDGKSEITNDFRHYEPSRREDDVRSETDFQSPMIDDASALNSVDSDSTADEMRRFSQSPLSTASSISASVGFYSDLSSRATFSSSPSSSSSSSSSSESSSSSSPFQSVDDPLQQVKVAVTACNVADTVDVSLSTRLALNHLSISAASASPNNKYSSDVVDSPVKRLRSAGELLTQPYTNVSRASAAVVNDKKMTAGSAMDLNVRRTMTRAEAAGTGSGNFFIGSTFYMEPIEIPEQVTATTMPLPPSLMETCHDIDCRTTTLPDRESGAISASKDNSSLIRHQSNDTSDSVQLRFPSREMDVFHCLHGKEMHTRVKIMRFTSSQDIIRQIFQKECLDADHRLHQLVVRKSPFNSQANDCGELRRIESPIDEEVASDSRLELIPKKTVPIKIICDVGAKRSRNLTLKIADDATGSDVIGSAIDQFKLDDLDASRYALIRTNKSTKDMIQVKESETVADLNNDCFLLCRSEHLAKTRSDESPQITEIGFAKPFSSSVAGGSRLDLDAVDSVPLSNEPPQTSLMFRSSTFDCAPSSPSAPCPGVPTLPLAASRGRLSVPNFYSPSLKRNISPSSRAMSSAEVITLQSRLRQLEKESATKERHWSERMSVVHKSLERFKALAFTTDVETRSALLEAELSDVMADFKLQEQRVKQDEAHILKHKESSVWVPEKIDELERKLAEAIKLRSAAAQDRDKLLPLIDVAETGDNYLRQRSTRETTAKSESLYDVISTIKFRCYVFGLSVGQTSLDQFRCNNDRVGFLVVSETSESSQLQLGDRIIELNSTPVFNATSEQFYELARSSSMPCRLVVVRETNEEPTLLNDICQWMQQFN